jgi:DNA-binding NarL/FixJ family response regulator
MPAPAFLIVDDHPLFLEALQSTLEVGFPGARVEVAHSIDGARSQLSRNQFNLVLLDLKMPDTSGLEGLQNIRSKCSDTPLAVISAMAGLDITSRVRSMGADGFIHKSEPRQGIVRSVQQLLDGGHCFPESSIAETPKVETPAENVIERLRQLTPQQFKVLAKVCEAKLNKQIAFELGVTETTIKAHITLIFKKLGVHSRTQAVLQLQRLRPELEETKFGQLLTTGT